MTEAPARRTLALISHDGKKADMVAFVKDHFERLSSFNLVATQTTGKTDPGKVGFAREVLAFRTLRR